MRRTARGARGRVYLRRVEEVHPGSQRPLHSVVDLGLRDGAPGDVLLVERGVLGGAGELPTAEAQSATATQGAEQQARMQTLSGWSAATMQTAHRLERERMAKHAKAAGSPTATEGSAGRKGSKEPNTNTLPGQEGADEQEEPDLDGGSQLPRRLPAPTAATARESSPSTGSPSLNA